MNDIDKVAETIHDGAVGVPLFSLDAHLKPSEDNWPGIYSCQSRSIFFTRPFVTDYSPLLLRFVGRKQRETRGPAQR